MDDQRDSPEPLQIPDDELEYHMAMMNAMEDGVESEEEEDSEDSPVPAYGDVLLSVQQVRAVVRNDISYQTPIIKDDDDERDSPEPLQIPDDELEYHMAMMNAMEDGVASEDDSEDSPTPCLAGDASLPSDLVRQVKGELSSNDRESPEPLQIPKEEEEYHMAMMAAMEDGVEEDRVQQVRGGEASTNDRESPEPLEIPEDEEEYHMAMMAAMEDGMDVDEDEEERDSEDNSSPGGATAAITPEGERVDDSRREDDDPEDTTRREDIRDDRDTMEDDYDRLPTPAERGERTERATGVLKRLFGALRIEVDARDDAETLGDEREAVPDNDEDDYTRNKRRRISESFYQVVPTLDERDQNLMEYFLPLTLPCMFKGLHFSTFAQIWCYVIVVGHTIETLVSDFGPRTMGLRVSFAWITPLYHHLCDCFWLHTFITAMFTVPHKFGSPDNKIQVFWMALLLVQTLPIYLAVSFKTHYLKHQDKVHKQARKRIELRLMDTFWFYEAATLFLWLSHVLSAQWCLWVGLTLWNVAPLYLTFSYKKRFENATMPREPKEVQPAETKGVNAHKKDSVVKCN